MNEIGFTQRIFIMKQFVVYSRQSMVSDREGQMTLETADFTVRHYLNTLGKEGIDYQVVARFEEIKSGYGKSSRNRKEFNQAVELCRQNKNYTLLVPNATRLSRNTAHGASLVEELDIVLANNPQANRTMKNLMILMGEDESYQQSSRRKACYQAKKEKCDKLGIVCEWGANSKKYQEKLKSGKTKHISKSTRSDAQQYWESHRTQVESVVKMMKSNKIKLTFQNICTNLKTVGLKSREGKELTPTQTQRVMEILNISR